jgi:ribosomal protein L4
VRSCRNLRNLQTTLAHQLNPYELLNAEALLVTAPALAAMKEIFAR